MASLARSGCASPVRNAVLLQRPFTALGARATRLVGVFVRWGEHLDRLERAAAESDDDAAERPSAPSTYVALHTRRHGEGDSLDAADHERHESYALRSSPFATTRVVERSAHPMWNEQLLVALPLERRHRHDEQQRQDAWELLVDVVRRDPSQQEDILLASVAVPLTAVLGSDRYRPRHFAVDLANGVQPAPRVYLSLTDTDDVEDPLEVTEVVIDEISEDATGAALVAPAPTETAAAIVVLSTGRKEPGDRNLRDLFEALHNNTAPPPRRTCEWITPMAKSKRTDNSSSHARLRWQYPAMLFRSGSRDDDSAARLDQVYVSLYSVTPSTDGSYTFVCTGAVVLELHHVPLDAATISVSATLSPPQVLQMTIRRWDSPSWMQFQSTSASRRVITTNRRHRKRTALQALEWTGALCRGLNRYPISSVCDEGGLSGLLARFLATASTDENQTKTNGGDGVTADATNGVMQPHEMLNQHIHLLQQEVMAKQATIQQLHREADANMTALRKCGAELVAARKDVIAREDVIAQLQTKLRELEQRKADQTLELLAVTGGITGLRLDSQGAQRLNMLIFKYKELEQRHAVSEAALVDAKRAVAAMEQLERKYMELEQAHVVQAGLVQRLQQDKTRQTELQRTIRMQEKVIQKLEKAVTLQPQPQSQPPLPSPPLPTKEAATDADSPLMAMRVQVLEQQLQTNAKAAALEIGRLKMRVLELETQLSSTSDSGSRSPTRRPER